jgi:hypothetical protein
LSVTDLRPVRKARGTRRVRSPLPVHCRTRRPALAGPARRAAPGRPPPSALPSLCSPLPSVSWPATRLTPQLAPRCPRAWRSARAQVWWTQSCA